MADEPAPPAPLPYETEVVADVAVRQKAEAKEARRERAARDMAADAAQRDRDAEAMSRWMETVVPGGMPARTGRSGGDVPSALSTSGATHAATAPPGRPPAPRCRAIDGA